MRHARLIGPAGLALVTFAVSGPAVADPDPHPAAINTAWCDFHGTVSPYDPTYADFASSLIGPRGNLNRTIQKQVELHQVGGASVVIIEDGAITQHHWYGCRDRKGSSRTSASTIYQAASLSKFVSAIGIVHADRHGDLSLDDDMEDIADAFPSSLLAEWVDDNFGGHESYPDLITVRRLLNHSAGLDTHGIGIWDPTNVPTMREIVLGTSDFSGSFAGGVEPLYAPGTTYEYSGGGYIVAEHILELHVPETFKTYLDQHVIANANLTLSTFDKGTTSMTNLVRGCSRYNCMYGLLQTNVKAAGGLLANAREYAELVTALVNGGYTDSGAGVMEQSDIDTILTPGANIQSTFEACSTPGDTRDFYLNVFGYQLLVGDEVCVAGKWRYPLLDGSDWYGLGVALSDTVLADGYSRHVSHGGDQDGTTTYFKIDRLTGDGIVVMINGNKEWVDGDGFTFGGDVLMNEITDAYNDVY